MLFDSAPGHHEIAAQHGAERDRGGGAAKGCVTTGCDQIIGLTRFGAVQ